MAGSLPALSGLSVAEYQICIECMAKAGRKDQISNEKEESGQMKKKCTASACRKTFHYKEDEFVVCPFCGKEYARMNGFGGNVICRINGVSYNFNHLKKINPKRLEKLS